MLKYIIMNKSSLITLKTWSVSKSHLSENQINVIPFSPFPGHKNSQSSCNVQGLDGNTIKKQMLQNNLQFLLFEFAIVSPQIVN